MAPHRLRFIDSHVHFWTHATHSWLNQLPSDHPVGDMTPLRADGFPRSGLCAVWFEPLIVAMWQYGDEDAQTMRRRGTISGIPLGSVKCPWGYVCRLGSWHCQEGFPRFQPCAAL